MILLPRSPYYRIQTTLIILAPRVLKSRTDFVAAMQTENISFLFERIHPAVLDIYGPGACQSYIEQVVDPTLEIEVLNVSGPGAWDFIRDDITTSIPNAYTVEANVSSQNQQATQELHYAPDDSGDLRWFTDCGDPLP